MSTQERRLSPGAERRITRFVNEDEEGDPPTLLTLSEIPPGTTIAGCSVERLIGRGGMGRVYLAEHLTLRKKVAIKVLPSELFAEPALVERFLREARLAAQLDHPNVVRVLNAGQERGLHFIEFEFVDGESLERRLARDGRLDLAEALRVAEQMARALAAAHALGIVHRDVKPANVLLGRGGSVKVADFGIAKAAFSKTAATSTGQVLGTPSYMAPEQAEGRPVDRRADLYGLGATLYAAITGQAPFGGETTIAILYSVVNRPPGRPSLVAPGIPPAVDRLVLCLLEKDPALRYATAEQVLAAIAAMGRGEMPPPPPTARRVRLRRWVNVVAGVLAVAIGIGIAARAGRGERTPEPAKGPSATSGGAAQPDPSPPSSGHTEADDAALEILEPIVWPGNWPNVLDKELIGQPRRLMGQGWVEEAEAWTASPGAGKCAIEIRSTRFVLDFDVAPVEGGLGLEVTWADDPQQPGAGPAYRLVLKDGASAEWSRLPAKKVLCATPVPQRGVAARKVRVGWFADGILALAVDGETLLHAQDLRATMPSQQMIGLAPVDGGMRITNARLELPIPQAKKPR